VSHDEAFAIDLPVGGFLFERLELPIHPITKSQITQFKMLLNITVLPDDGTGPKSPNKPSSFSKR
jgi:hypothetical protein